MVFAGELLDFGVEGGDDLVFLVELGLVVVVEGIDEGGGVLRPLLRIILGLPIRFMIRIRSSRICLINEHR